MPKDENLPDRMSIYTILSATYDDEDKQTLYDATVETLTEDNLFKVPANAELVENGPYGVEMKYPFSLNSVEEPVAN